MQNEVSVTSYQRGMQQDFNPENALEGTYYEAFNFRINGNKGSAVLGLSNDICNSLLFQLPENHKTIGTCKVRDTIVLLTTQNNSDEGGEGFIWVAEIEKVNNTLGDLQLKYQHVDLKFTTKRPIEVLGYYENESIQRIFFSDYNQPTRSVNLKVIDNTYPIEGVSLFPNISIRCPKINDVVSGGNLKVGVYEYFIYFTSKDGKNTLYSANSNQVHIVKSSESVDNTLAYSGNIELDSNGENILTDKAVKIDVNLEGIPLNLFNKVTLCCIYATNTISEPIVLKLEEKVYNDSDVFFLHTGLENQILIDSATYAINQHPFYTNKTFAVKDDALTFSNIKTQVFNMDWDTECKRYKSNGDVHLPYINPFNDESGKSYGAREAGVYDDWLNLDQYKFQSDGVTLGGQSLDGSIRYKFKMIEIVTDENTVSTYYTSNPVNNNNYLVNGQNVVNKTFNSFHSPFMRNLAGYKREEIYRFGIIGIKNGNASFVSYIGDIKFPSISDVANYITVNNTSINHFKISEYDSVNNVVRMYTLGIEFSINVPNNVDIDHYQIVRVPREQQDKTRLCTGVITQFTKPDNEEYWHPLDQLVDIRHYYGDTSLAGPLINAQVENARRDLVNFYTPEATYDHNLPTSTNNNYLKVVSILNDTSKFGRNSLGTLVSNLLGQPNNYLGTTKAWTTKARTTNPVNNPSFNYHLEKIRYFKKSVPGFGADDSPERIGGIDYRNYTWYSDVVNTAPSELASNGGTGITCKLDVVSTTVAPFDQGNAFNDYNINTDAWTGKTFLIDMVNFKIDQYGGQGVENIAYNKFIAITDLIPVNVNKSINMVLGGDIYVGWYEFMKTFWDNTRVSGDNESFYENVIIPIESSINFELNAGKTLKEGSTYTYNNDTQNYRSQESGMFTYNPVFSKSFLSRAYFSKPFDFIEQTTFDVRTYISDNKIIGESIDSFSKVRINNFKDANPKLGSITRTLEYANEVFVIQEQGVSFLPINAQAMVGAGTGESVILGTAAGFQDHVYLSHNKGSIHQWACKVLDDGIYFYDGMNHQLVSIRGNQLEDLSVSLGMDSFFNKQLYNINLTKINGGDNPLENKGVHMGYDKQNSELYITFLGTNEDNRKDKTTLIFNTDWKVFTSNYSMFPNIYIEDQKFLYTPNPSISSDIYIQNKGIPNQFYGTRQKSYITFYANASPESSKILRFIDYDLVMKDLSGNFVTGEGLDNIRVKNNYQDTNTIALTGRQRLMFNRWRIQRIPRNTNQPGKISRMRNDWHLVTLEFSNFLNRYINLERIFSIYNKQ